MFIARVQTPSIGLHKWTNFDSSTYVIDAITEEEALNVIRSTLDPKDPKVQAALIDQDEYKDGEYFRVDLYHVPSDTKIVYIHKPSSGFYECSKTLML